MNTEITITRLKHHAEFAAKNKSKVTVQAVSRVCMTTTERKTVEREISLIITGPITVEGREFSHETKLIVQTPADHMLPHIVDLNNYADSRRSGLRGQEEATVTLFEGVLVGYIFGESKDDEQPFITVKDSSFGTRKILFEDPAALRSVVGAIHNGETS